MSGPGLGTQQLGAGVHPWDRVGGAGGGGPCARPDSALKKGPLKFLGKNQKGVGKGSIYHTKRNFEGSCDNLKRKRLVFIWIRSIK